MNGIWAENLYEHGWCDECSWLNVGFAALNPTYGGYGGVKRGYMVCGNYAG